MVTTKHRVLSLILCIMLAVSAVCAGSMAVSAATGDTVYVRANNGWANLYCYMWTDGAGNVHLNAQTLACHVYILFWTSSNT